MSEMEKRKLYIPIAVKVNKNGEPFNSVGELEEIDGIYYAEQINEAIQKSLEHTEGRGLAENLFGNTGAKTYSLYPSVEVHNHELVGVLTFETPAEYTTRDNVVFFFWVENKMEDEWAGEFEMQPLQTDEGEIYVSFFPADRELTIQTEEEFFGQQHGEMQMS